MTNAKLASSKQKGIPCKKVLPMQWYCTNVEAYQIFYSAGQKESYTVVRLLWNDEVGIAIGEFKAADWAAPVVAQPHADAFLAKQMGAGHLLCRPTMEFVQTDKAPLGRFLFARMHLYSMDSMSI